MIREGKNKDVDQNQGRQRRGKKELRKEKKIKTGEEIPEEEKRLLGAEEDLKENEVTKVKKEIVKKKKKKLAERLAILGQREGWLYKSR